MEQNQRRTRRRNRNRGRNNAPPNQTDYIPLAHRGTQPQNTNAPVAQTGRRGNRNRQQNQPQQPQQNQTQPQLSFFNDFENFMENQTGTYASQIVYNIRNNRYTDLQRSDGEGDTPLMYAIMYSSLDDGIIQALVESGQGRINAINDDGKTALFVAIDNEGTRKAIYLINNPETNINIRVNGMDALQYARRFMPIQSIIDALTERQNQQNQPQQNQQNQPIIPNYDPNRNLVREILMLRTNPENEARIVREIQAGILNPGEVSTRFYNMTPLMFAIDLGFYHVAEKLIQTEINLDNVDDYGNTALILAAKNRIFDICDILIDKNANVGQINNDSENAMIFLLKEYSNTPATHYNNEHIKQLLLKLAETRRADSGNASDLDGHNSVYYINNIITDNNLKQRLKELIINTPPIPFTALSTINKMRKIQNFENVFRTPAGPRNDQERIRYRASIDNYKDNIRVSIVNNTFNKDELTPTNKNTILMQAILTDAIRGTAIPSLLISTGNSKPDAVNRAGKTALIMACENNLPDIALRLLNTGNANINQIDSQGHNALYYAQNAAVDFTQVINIIQPPAPAAPAPPAAPNVPDTNININLTGFNSITQERQTIRDFLASDNNNVVFVVNNEILFSNKNYIRTQLNNNVNNKYGCKQAGDQMRFQLDNNINFTPIYFTLSAIAPVQILVKKDEMESLLRNSNKLYICYSTTRILPAIISVAYHQGTTGGISADHCQPGKATHVYALTPGNLVDIPIDNVEEEPVAAQEQEQTVKVQYKGVTYTFPITLETTLNDLKDMLLNKLVQENQIQTNKYNVKFIYTGKIYKDNDLNKQLTQLANPPFGITLQSMVSPIVGGKKRKTKRRNNKRKKLTKRI